MLMLKDFASNFLSLDFEINHFPHIIELEIMISKTPISFGPDAVGVHLN